MSVWGMAFDLLGLFGSLVASMLAFIVAVGILYVLARNTTPARIAVGTLTLSRQLVANVIAAVALVIFVASVGMFAVAGKVRP